MTYHGFQRIAFLPLSRRLCSCRWPCCQHYETKAAEQIPMEFGWRVDLNREGTMLTFCVDPGKGMDSGITCEIGGVFFVCFFFQFSVEVNIVCIHRVY